MLTSHIKTLKNKKKLIPNSLNNQTLKNTMAEVVSQELSSEVGPLVEPSVKKLKKNMKKFEQISINITEDEHNRHWGRKRVRF